MDGVVRADNLKDVLKIQEKVANEFISVVPYETDNKC
jgi:hypothetical protein